ncbi:SDR family NAD(P)-dependent oxidoreductase (plasmid) [Rhodococcus opacus]|uniref:SDR family NAD(P)-dependent oxidoreductase n=1 Tax=Rhodococcus opacus TaxID=37919 RepID=UPI0034D364B0
MVTGAGSGIGQSIAQQFARSGDIVYALDIDEGRAKSALVGVDGDIRPVRVDVRDYEHVASVLGEARERTGRLDVVVNSAGVFDGYAGIQGTTPELWQRVIELNLTGAFNVARAAGLLMLKDDGGGRIIMISSIGGERASLDGLSYVTSKAGLNHMVRRLAFELGRENITVNAVCPGSIGTNLKQTSEEILGNVVDMSNGIGRAMTAETLNFVLPAGRSGTTDEVAAVVEFLAGPGGSYVNGQAIAVDGGWTAG